MFDLDSGEYYEKVYAGILGKIIGVYLGRPIEGWTYEKIQRELGDITYFMNDRIPDAPPLIVTDDDIAGTFTFVRAIEDFGCSKELTSEQIGRTWLNYIIENRTILFWGGLGNATEHTAYLHLKQGIPAPHSGSRKLNGKILSEQIGAQIFIDGWSMLAPGDPGLAINLAGKAARVSHDGEAVTAAQFLAAMEAQAFTENDLMKIVDIALGFIPPASIISRLAGDLIAWHANLKDWREARLKIVEKYGYDRYGGVCHVVPNHALILLGLLYGNGDFDESLRIVNTCGWDTDCNSGNLGCLLGIRNGLAGLSVRQDWRSPVADRMYLPTVDGGNAVTDALREADHIVSMARRMNGMPDRRQKKGARYHFSLPGSLQGFFIEGSGSKDLAGRVRNEDESLRIDICPGADHHPVLVKTATFIPPEHKHMRWYELIASPALYSGQTLRAALTAAQTNRSSLCTRAAVQYYDHEDIISTADGPAEEIRPGETRIIQWQTRVPDGCPIVYAGVQIETGAEATLYLDWLTWDGDPCVRYCLPDCGGTMWQRAWVNAVDQTYDLKPELMRLIQNHGRGMMLTGTRDWQDLQISTHLIPHLIGAFGVAGRVQGLQRYYAVMIEKPNTARLIKMDHAEKTLAQGVLDWKEDEWIQVDLITSGDHIQCSVNGRQLLSCRDTHQPLLNGCVGMIVEEGCLGVESVSIGMPKDNQLDP